MKIYHIEFAKAGIGLSGGEICMLEVAREFSEMQIENIILTTDNGRSVYEKSVPSGKYIKYKTIDSYRVEKMLGVLISYFHRLGPAIKLIRGISFDDQDIVLCHSEFLPNSISNWVANRGSKNIRSGNFFHMRAPRLFRGYEGEFTNRWHFPSLRLAHYRLSQWVYRKLTHPRSVILTVNPFYLNYLVKAYPRNRIMVLTAFGEGRLDGEAGEVSRQDKKYDLLWVGRFHSQKGINDLLDVIGLVKKACPKISVAILGDGDKVIRQNFIERISGEDLKDNIEWPGFVTGDMKMEYFKNSRVFLMPSHYESMPVVMLEAMANGLPVVAYALPVYGAFREGIIRVKILDTNAMADESLRLLNEPEYYSAVKTKALKMAEQHSWRGTARNILDSLGASKI